MKTSAASSTEFPLSASVRARPYTFKIPVLEAVTFSFSLVIALLLAISSHASDALAFGSLNDYVTPFLWGFGLDQIKQQATRLQS